MKRALPVLGLASFLFLVPLLLYGFMGGPYLPTVDFDQLKETLSGPFLSVDSVIRGLGLLTWALWAYLVIVIVLRSIGVVALQRGSPSGRRLIALTSLMGPAILLRVVDVAVGAILLIGPVASGKVEASPPNAPHASVSVQMADANREGAVEVQAPLRSYVVRPGDSLWRIAERELGSGTRWPEIFDLNKERSFPDERRLTNPRLIHPNWILWLPGAPSNGSTVPSTVEVPSVETVPEPPIPALEELSPDPQSQLDPVGELDLEAGDGDEEEEEAPTGDRRPIVVNLPSGAALAASFASGILASHAISLLRRRRRFRPLVDSVDVPTDPTLLTDIRRWASPEPTRMSSVIAEVGDWWQDQAGAWPQLIWGLEETERVSLLVRGQVDPKDKPRFAIESSGAFTRVGVERPFSPSVDRPSTLKEGTLVPLGTTGSGGLLHLSLTGAGCVSLLDEGAAQLAVQMMLACLAGRSADEVEVYVCGDGKAFGSCLELPHIRKVEDWPDADVLLQDLHTEMLARARAFAERGVADISAYLASKDAEPMPSVIVFAIETPEAMRGIVEALASQSARHGAAVVSIGWRPEVSQVVLRAGSEIRIESPFPLEAKEVRPLVIDEEAVDAIVGIFRQAHPASSEVDAETGAEPPVDDLYSVERPSPVLTIPKAVGEMDAAEETDAAIVRCLGPFVTFRRGKPVTKGWRTSAKGMLAYLIAHPDWRSREAVETVLWPGVEVKKAHKLFNDALYHIRNLFLDPNEKWSDKYLVRERDDVRLEPGRWDIDAWRFESLIASSSSLPSDEAISHLRDALALYGGDFFQGFDPPWIESIRMRYRNLFVTASVKLAGLLRDGGDEDGALEILTGAVEREPLCEDLYRRVIVIHAAAGRKSDAEAVYRKLATVLAQELGEEPEPATEELMSEVRKSPRGRPELVREPL